MAAAIYNLFIEQGADFYDALDVSGDYTSYTIRGNIIDVEGNTTTGIVAWTDDTEGEFEITLTNVETSAMISGTGKYDIEVESPTGYVMRLLQGRVYVDGEITV